MGGYKRVMMGPDDEVGGQCSCITFFGASLREHHLACIQWGHPHSSQSLRVGLQWTTTRSHSKKHEQMHSIQHRQCVLVPSCKCIQLPMLRTVPRMAPLKV